MATPSRREEVSRLLSLRKDGTFTLDLKYFRHHSEDVAYEWHGGAPVCGPLFSPALVDTLGPPRDPDSPIDGSPSQPRFCDAGCL